MIKKILLATTAALAVVAVPSTASARPVLDPPEGHYCGPAGIFVGANGDRYGCARTELPPDPMDDGGIFAALGAAFVVGWFL